MNSTNKGIFRSYWQAGYEGADHINGVGLQLSMNDATQHTNLAYDDYLLLKDFEIGTVRESVGWRSVEKDGYFDFSAIESRAQGARVFGLQVIWTLCHYRWPDDVDICSPDFIHRFSHYCCRVSGLPGQVALAQQLDVDLQGICLHPTVDRPDWDDPHQWHKSGLREVSSLWEKRYQRVLSEPYAIGLPDAQRLTARFSNYSNSSRTQPSRSRNDDHYCFFPPPMGLRVPTAATSPLETG